MSSSPVTTAATTTPDRTILKSKSSPNIYSNKNKSSSTSFSSKSMMMMMMMKFLPHKRRQSQTVKNTAVVVEDYMNLLRGNNTSKFFTYDADGTVATLSSHTTEDNNNNNSSNNNMMTITNMTIDDTNNNTTTTEIASLDRKEIVLGSLLGKGAFSKVYEVQSILVSPDDDEDSARARIAAASGQNKFVMKRLKQRLTKRPKDFTAAAANLMMEAQFLTELHHPHILQLRGIARSTGSSAYSTGKHDSYFLLLDRLSETLDQRIHSTWKARRDPQALRQLGPLNETSLLQEKAQYALQLASALHYLHDQRIVFRDLKPNNIGFLHGNTVKLFDFGLARELPAAMGLGINELFHMTQHAGTRPYTAPEVATTGLYNAKADVYSWAMVVYEIMTEQIPFLQFCQGKQKYYHNSDFCRAVFVDHTTPSFAHTFQAPVPTPARIQTLLTKCWSNDLFERPTMQGAMTELELIVTTEFGVASDAAAAAGVSSRLMQQVQDVAEEEEECSDLSQSSD